MLTKQNPFAAKEPLNFFRRHKVKLEKFAAEIKTKLGDDLVGVLVLLPEEEDDDGGKTKKRKQSCEVAVIVSDITSKNVGKIAKKREEVIGKSFKKCNLGKKHPEIIHVSALWEICVDSTVQPSMIIRFMGGVLVADSNFLVTFILALHHKKKVMKKFEKYVVCYCFSGSSVRGTSTSKSDLDVFCILDDTDVKRMPLAELRDKLHNIIIKMGDELAAQFDIELNINSQLYVLTHFWESLKNGSPVIYTLLRDAVPLYDKGLITPWKKMLRTGRIKPSLESDEALIEGANSAFNDAGWLISKVGPEQLYYSLLNYAQAILLIKGHPPLTPQETVQTFKNDFLKKPYSFSRTAFKTLSKVVLIRKKLEYGERKRLSPNEISTLYKEVQEAQKVFSKFHKQIQKENREAKLRQLMEFVLSNFNGYVNALSVTFKGRLKRAEINLFLSQLPVPNKTISELLSHLSDLENKAKEGKYSTKKHLFEIELYSIKAIKAIERIVEILTISNSQLFEFKHTDHKWLVSIGNNGAVVLPLQYKTNQTMLRFDKLKNGKFSKNPVEIDVHDLLICSDSYRLEGKSQMSITKDFDFIHQNLMNIVTNGNV
ncbi:MAG: nucleotidyltransferase domain-containing protein [Planctomycetes bacterium]|nr:nucleotidyltransferase domain-containing protein [Planctomycetota bacterium]